MNIGVVLVTYNRLEKLKIALKKYDEQSYLPKYVMVVNNNSNDGTFEYLEEWKSKSSNYEKIVLNMSTNLGGSGGFYSGIKESLFLNVDWIWVSDDDAFLEHDVFEKINQFYQKNNAKDNIVALCGKVINKDESIAYDHRRTMKKGVFKIHQINSKSDDYKKEYFEINTFSYVGSMMKKEILFKSGITNKDYFIYYDDTEHSYRLSKEGKIICVSAAEIFHDTLDGGKEINWKSYYGIRNRLDFVKRNFGKRLFFNSALYIKIKCLIKTVFRIKYNKDEINLQLTAIEDAKSNKFGIHEIYKPGWKAKK